MIIALLLGIPFMWWIAILTGLFIAEAVLIACDEYGWSATIMTIAILTALYVDHYATASWVSAHLSHIFLFYIPAYLGLGLATAFLKWVLYVAKRVRWIKEARATFSVEAFRSRYPSSKDQSINEIFVRYYREQVPSYKHQVNNDVDWSKPDAIVNALTPRAKDNVGKITIWVYQWPIVILASIIEDLILKLAKHFARILDAIFSKYVRSMVAKAVSGL